MFGKKKLQSDVEILKEKVKRLEHVIDFLSARDLKRNRAEIRELSNAWEDDMFHEAAGRKVDSVLDRKTDVPVITDDLYIKIDRLATKDDISRMEGKLTLYGEVMDALKSLVALFNKSQV